MGKRITLFLALVAAMLLALPTQGLAASAVTKDFAKKAAPTRMMKGVKAKETTAVMSRADLQQKQRLARVLGDVKRDAFEKAEANKASFEKFFERNLQKTMRGENRKVLDVRAATCLRNAKAPRKLAPAKAEQKDENGLINEPGEGVRKIYNISGQGYTYSNSQVSQVTLSGTTQIVECEDGTVYIKDIVPVVSLGVWVKGTRTGNTITVPTKQPVYYDSEYDATMSVRWASGDQTGATAADATAEAFTFVVDDEAGTISLQGTTANLFMALIWDDDNLWGGYGAYETVFTFDHEYVAPDIVTVTPPVGIEAETWYTSGHTYSKSIGLLAFEGTVGFIKDGDNIYLQGVFSDFPEAWMMGTVEGNTVTFKGLQLQGDYYSYTIYGVGADDNGLADFVMTYDEEAGTLTSQNVLLANAAEDKIYYLTWIDDIVINRDAPEPITIDELPYSNALNTAELFGEFKVIDANGDGKTWSYGSMNFAQYSFSSSVDADDWLVSPAIKLEAGKAYRFAVDVWARNANYPERIEVKMGTEPTALTQEVIDSTDVAWDEAKTLENTAVTVAEDGYYYIGLHAISDKDCWFLIASNFIVEEGADVTAPEAVTNLTVEPLANKLGATVKFNAPTKAINGSELTSLTKIDVLRDDSVVYSFINGPDSIDWTAADQGYSNSEAVTAIDFGGGLTAELTDGGNNNAPKYYNSGTALRMYAKNQMTLKGKSIKKVVFTFTGSAAQQKLEANAGNYEYADGIGTWTGEADEIVFTVPDGSGNQARIQKIEIAYEPTITLGEELEYVDDAADLTMGNHTYQVIPYGATGAGQKSEPITVFLSATIEVPYAIDLTEKDNFGLFQVINANEDNSTWSWHADYGTYYLYGTVEAEDYLVLSSPVHFEANKTYNITVSANCASASYPERLMVKIGKEATVDALTQVVIDTVTVDAKDPAEYEAEFSVAETGDYYVAIEAVSEADMYRLMVNSLSINKGAEPDAPAAVADLSVLAGAEGALEVNISFTAPAKAISGDNLTNNLDSVVILRDGVAVGRLVDVAAGSAQNWKDTDVEQGGVYAYQVVGYNAAGRGLKSEKQSVYVGVDTPADLENLQLADIGGTQIAFTWNPVTTGANGGYVDPAKILYGIWTVGFEEFLGMTYPYLDECVDSLYNASSYNLAANLDEGEQGWTYYAVQPKNEVGTGSSDMAAIWTGAPYELPFSENFAGSQLHSMWDTSDNLMLYVSDDASDEDGVALKVALDSEAEDPLAYMATGKISFAQAANPTLLFDVKSYATNSTLSIVGYNSDSEIEVLAQNVLAQANSTSYTNVKLPLSGIKDERYNRIAFVINFATPTDSMLIDNIKIVDLYEYDLAVDVKGAKTLTTGDSTTVFITVTNEGENAANGYTVKLTAGEKELFTAAPDLLLAPFAKDEYEVQFKTSIFDQAADVTLKAEVVYDLDLNEDNNVAETIISVTEPAVAAPTNLLAQQEDEAVKLSWTAPEAGGVQQLTESFEDADVFPEFSIGGITAAQSTGTMGDWTFYDGNGTMLYGFNNLEVPNLGNPSAWIVFAPASAQLSTDLSGSYPAHTGDQYMASFCNAEPEGAVAATDHWMISPELPGTAQELSFFARALTDSYGAETFQVLVSSTDNSIESFTPLKNESTTATEWTEFKYNLPEGTKYFAIRHTSTDVFALFVDDITYMGSSSVEVANYNIYVDAEVNGTANETSFSIPVADLTSGNHVFAVTAVYTNGKESKSVTATLDVVNAIQQIMASGKPFSIYTLDGKLISTHATSLKGLKGAYVIDNKKVIVK